MAALGIGLASVASAADMAKPAQVFILLGQSNMLGMGRIAGGKDGTLEHAVKAEKKYPYLVDADGNWAVWKESAMSASWMAEAVECRSSTTNG